MGLSAAESSVPEGWESQVTIVRDARRKQAMELTMKQYQRINATLCMSRLHFSCLLHKRNVVTCLSLTSMTGLSQCDCV